MKIRTLKVCNFLNFFSSNSFLFFWSLTLLIHLVRYCLEKKNPNETIRSINPKNLSFKNIRYVRIKHIIIDHKYSFGNMLLINFLAFFSSRTKKVLGAIIDEKKIRLPMRNGNKKFIIWFEIIR